MVGVISAVAYGGLRVADTSRERPTALRNKCKLLNDLDNKEENTSSLLL
jgi:hypothetical protein